MTVPQNTKKLSSRLLNVLRPPPKLTISQWAEKERVVSSEETSAPGPWFADRAPYTVGIMDAISDNTVEKIVVEAGAQMGKTNAGIMNPIGYYITHDPCPIMVVQPTIAMGTTFSGKRLTPMLRDTPCLRGKVSSEKSRSSENKILEKSFPGGYIVIAGANSAPSLKSRPVRIVLFDEVDEAPPDLAGQGDPVELAFARTNAFPNRKIVLTSTPTVKGRSRIDAAFNDSSKGRWSHKCPKCGEWSQFKWKRLVFDCMKMTCPHCGELFTRQEWEEGGGMWVEENPDHPVKGFHVNALDSQMTWDELVVKFAEAVQLSKKGDHSKLITFTNTILAETWEYRGEVVEAHALEAKREVYNAELPDGVCVLTMGVDVQNTRLAYEVVGWGMGFESWGIEYAEIFGDPQQWDVWNRLDEVLNRTWSYRNGKRLRITRAAVDTGFKTNYVYTYCKAREGRGVYAIKGDTRNRQQLTRPSKNKKELSLFIVNVDMIKKDVTTWLRIGKPGDGFCHFPKAKDDIPVNGYDTVYFDMLTTEKEIPIQNKKGFTVYEWRKVAGERNESFDCRIYARAALNIMSSKEEIMLRNIFLTMPWAETDASGTNETPVVDNKPAKPKKVIDRNKLAREKGIYL